ncbi:hypothetical protein B4U37_20400 [Sutcliffiella horikoshii]|uniref:Uncharacterized protein n=1 Tax=Sutcliffiella horikoshii TaxID=79883 RepID=A0ABM6KP32_9BACI|nr:hypothetical protein B4U37_20400 [Sutcliffiella horikoshii]
MSNPVKQHNLKLPNSHIMFTIDKLNLYVICDKIMLYNSRMRKTVHHLAVFFWKNTEHKKAGSKRNLTNEKNVDFSLQHIDIDKVLLYAYKGYKMIGFS